MKTSIKILLVLVFIWTVTEGYCKKVPIESARKVAKNVYSEAVLTQEGKLPSGVDFSDEISLGGIQDTLMYAFNLAGNAGYIIISGDDAAHPVLCYSLNGSFSENPAGRPEGFNLFLRSYEQQLAEIRRLGLEPTPLSAEDWNYYLNEPFNLKNGPSSAGPLLTTSWDQNCLYNALCPADAAAACGHVPTGCGATALGQILRYFQYPRQGKGQYGYTHPKYGYLSVDFSAASYDYARMPDAATASDYLEIAKLLYHCGVASQANYNISGTATNKIRIKEALISNFGFSPNVDAVFKVNYTDADWKALIRSELDNDRPVFYDGAECATCDGHSFVCDGYQQADYFHFNWGWSGNYNGYFYISDLTPGTHDFTPFQSALVGIAPETAEHIPPLNLEAKVEGNDVRLTWTPPPSQPVAEWMHHDNAYSATTEFSNPIDYKVAMRFDTAQLARYDGLKLTKIRLIVGKTGPKYRLNVWTGANAATSVLDQEIPEEFALDWIDIYNQHEVIWNTFILSQPIIIDASQELWIGYSCINSATEKPAPGHDTGPAVTGYGDMVYFEGYGWHSMHVTYPTWDYNWSLEAFVTDVYGNSLELKTANPSGLLGYDIFRNGTKINSEAVVQTTYSDYDLAPGTYTYTVKALYDSGSSGPSGPAEVKIEGQDLNAPKELSAAASGHDVQLTWHKPAPSIVSEWIHYDDGNNHMSVGLASGGTLYVAIRFLPGQLTTYDGMFIERVRLFPCAQNTSYQLFIAKGANASTILANVPLTGIEIDQWDTVDLAEPVPIDVTRELWIGYKIINHPADDMPAGADKGPAVAGYGDMISTNGTNYTSIYSINPDFNYNWNIQALVTNHPVQKAVDLATGPAVTGLLGYNLYRNDQKINKSVIADTTYLDTGLPTGVYDYHVTAFYDKGESGPSNTVTVNLNFDLIEETGNYLIKIYPNPSDSYIIVETLEDFRHLRIVDMTGHEVYRTPIGINKTKIPLEGFNPGVYAFLFTSDSKTVVRKVTINSRR